MKKIPDDIAHIFSKRMKAANISDVEQRQYLKWLRYYLDFCDKYKHSPVNTDSADAFMLKLNEKNQTFRQQRQASKSVIVYRDIIKSHNRVEHGVISGFNNDKKNTNENKWDAVFDRLREEIRIRNYSNKTYSTYANWIGRFEHFLNSKAPDDVAMTDVKAFLNYLAVQRKIAQCRSR